MGKDLGSGGNEKKQKAVALKYDAKKDLAPRVKAKGEGEIAKKIIELAKTYDIPIKKDADMVELLSKIEINREVPPMMYKAIAEIFAFLYRTTKNKN